MANEISISVKRRSVTCSVNTTLVGGSANSIECVFSFDDEWDGLTKSAIFQTASENGKTVETIPVLLQNDRCMLPPEAASSGEYVKISAVGTRDGNVIVPTAFCQVFFEEGCYTGEVAPTMDVYLQMLSTFGEGMSQLEDTEEAVRVYAEEAEKNLPLIQKSAQTAFDKAEEASESAANAKTSEINAKESEDSSSQNLSDFLAMLGTDVATLVGGKIPAEQIPAIATTEVYTAATAGEMTALVAQNGDICIRTDENKSYIYKDTGWVYLASPTDYASNAGHADTADNAVNASMINNHRMVEMTAEEFQSAVKDPDTYYLVG